MYLFFFQAEDGIRDYKVTGVQTCALPISPEARRGHPGPRVAEFAGGMLNAVGLANPGLEAVREHELPWLAAATRRARVLVNVAGGTMEDYERGIAGLTDLSVITAFEINASWPNTKAGRAAFCATPE